MVAFSAPFIQETTLNDPWIIYHSMEDTNEDQHPFTFPGEKNLLKGSLPQHFTPKDITIKKYTAQAKSSTAMMDVCNKIDRKLESYGISENKRQNFVIALAEAINNAQEHGCQFAEKKKVTIHFYNLGDKYYLAGVENKGKPIDVEKIRELLLKNTSLQNGVKRGRGFLLMMKTVDVLFVSSNETQTEVFLGIAADSEL